MANGLLARHNCFHKPEDVEVGMNMSLKNLALDYGKPDFDIRNNTLRVVVVDLYLMHCMLSYL